MQMRQVDRSYGDLILGVLRLVRFSQMRTDLESAWMLQVVPCDQRVRLGGQVPASDGLSGGEVTNAKYDSQAVSCVEGVSEQVGRNSREGTAKRLKVYQSIEG